jgi:effector-binding domain-containing protein
MKTWYLIQAGRYMPSDQTQRFEDSLQRMVSIIGEKSVTDIRYEVILEPDRPEDNKVEIMTEVSGRG